MIYGLCRVIYLLRKHDIISVPFIREAYIICEADIIALAISPVPSGTDIIVKNLFCPVDKRGFLHGAGYGSRTRLLALGRPHNTDIPIPRFVFLYYSRNGRKIQPQIVAAIRYNLIDIFDNLRQNCGIHPLISREKEQFRHGQLLPQGVS